MDALRSGPSARRWALIAAVVVLVIVVAVVVTSVVRQRDEPSPKATPEPDDVKVSVPDVWLYETYSEELAVGPSGRRRDAVLRGERSATSTGFWVGCDGEPAVSIFSPDGRHDRLRTTLFLDPEIVPDGLAVQVTLLADGSPLKSWRLTPESVEPVDIEVGDARDLRIEAEKVAGECTNERIGYGIAFDAALTAD